MSLFFRYMGMFGMGLLLMSGCYVDQKLPHPLQHNPCPNPYNPACAVVLDGSTKPPPSPDQLPHGGKECGNQRCEGNLGENCFTCAVDCGCSAGQLCAQGTCTYCGNGTCEPAQGETCASCIADCGCPAGSLCANNQCQKAVQCGDGKCDPVNENCGSCAADCPCAQGNVCKAGRCELEPHCGNKACEAARGENCQSCPSDCGCQQNQGCRNNNCYQCACVPGQKRCFNEQIQVCSASCLEWQVVEVCQAADLLKCNPASFTCDCDTSRTCSAAGVQRCAPNGNQETCVQGRRCLAWQSSPCKLRTPDHRMFCDKGKCCECIPGERACHNEDQYEICGSDCLWGKARDCSFFEYCEKGGYCY